MPRMKKLRLSRSFSSFFLSSETRRNCIPNVLIVRPQMTLEWHLKTKARINVYHYISDKRIYIYNYISYYIIFLKKLLTYSYPFYIVPEGFSFLWVLNCGTPQIICPRVDRHVPYQIAVLAHSRTRPNVGIAHGTIENDLKQTQATRATPMSHRMVEKQWKNCRKPQHKESYCFVLSPRMRNSVVPLTRPALIQVIWIAILFFTIWFSSAEGQEYQFELNGILISRNIDRAQVFACFCRSEGAVLPCYPQLGLRATWRPRKMRCKQVIQWQYSQDLSPHCLHWPPLAPLAPIVGGVEWDGKVQQGSSLISVVGVVLLGMIQRLLHFCESGCWILGQSWRLTAKSGCFVGWCRVVPVLTDPFATFAAGKFVHRLLSRH